jgi:hypothetical protein
VDHILIRGGAIALVAYVVFMPLGVINIKHNIEPWFGAVAGGFCGLAAATILNWPSFEPIGFAIIVSVAFAVSCGAAAYIGFVWVRELKAQRAA